MFADKINFKLMTATEEVVKINKIKEVLFFKEKSQRWLADQLGAGYNTMANWCNNKNQPHLKDLKRIAEVLNVNIKDLLYDTPVKAE